MRGEHPPPPLPWSQNPKPQAPWLEETGEERVPRSKQLEPYAEC